MRVVAYHFFLFSIWSPVPSKIFAFCFTSSSPPPCILVVLFSFVKALCACFAFDKYIIFFYQIFSGWEKPKTHIIREAVNKKKYNRCGRYSEYVYERNIKGDKNNIDTGKHILKTRLWTLTTLFHNQSPFQQYLSHFCCRCLLSGHLLILQLFLFFWISP